MVKKTILTILVVWTLVASQAMGWFSWSEDYEKCYVAGANPDQNVVPTGEDAQEDDIKVDLPLTIRVRTRASTYPIEKVKLQWKLQGASTWNDIAPTYEKEGANYEFDADEYRFGRAPNYTLTAEDVTAGETILVRIHIASISYGYQNASLGVDTTDEGTNGWSDTWVMSFVIQENTRPSMPGQ